MVIAFLDMLGFSNLIRNYNLTAINNAMAVSHEIETLKLDNIKGYSLSSFKCINNFSDSLIIIADKPDLFVEQLSDFLCIVYCKYIHYFSKKFTDINDIKCEARWADVIDTKETNAIDTGKTGKIITPFPILYKGAVSCEKNNRHEIRVFEGFINNPDMKTFVITDEGYLDAVEMEKAGKGPRIFCSKRFYDSLSDESKRYVIKAENTKDSFKDVYEIIWTYRLCRKHFADRSEGCLTKLSISNIKRSLDTTLSGAKNLYLYYRNIEQSKNTENLSLHYKELIMLIIKGAVLIAEDNDLHADSLCPYLSEHLPQEIIFEINSIIISNTVLNELSYIVK